MVLHHIWDSGYQHGHRSYSGKSLTGDSTQFSVLPIGYVQLVAAFVLLSLVEVYLVACCLVQLSMDHVSIDTFERILVFFAIYLLFIVVALFEFSVVSRGPNNYHLVSVSLGQNMVEEVVL